MTSFTPVDEALVLERRFAAPPETVWRAWTDPEVLVRWYKPMASCETEVLRFDLRVGGSLLYQMRFGPGATHTELWEFTEVQPPHRLGWKQMLADGEGQVVRNERMPEWPQVLETIIELSAEGEETLQRMTWRPHDATPEEVAFFLGSAADMGGRGWISAFESLRAEVEA